MKIVEIIFSCALAAGLHLGAFALWPQDGSSTSGGQGGQQSITIHSSASTYDAMVKKWQSEPEVNDTTPELAALIPDAAPTHALSFSDAPARTEKPAKSTQSAKPDSVPNTSHKRTSIAIHVPDQPNTRSALPAIPRLKPSTDHALPRASVQQERPAIKRTALPNVDTKSTAATGPLVVSKRPKTAPRRVDAVNSAAKNKPKPKQSQSSSASTAAGAGSQKITKTAKPKSKGTTSQSNGRQNQLKRAWAARIVAKIQRKMPGTTKTTKARAVISVTVARSGKLLSVRLARSSGISTLDQMAVQAARAARVFPRAPKGLTASSYTHRINVKFN